MKFEIPVVLIIYKRERKVLQIIEQISQVQPQTVYILADGPRNSAEADKVVQCRAKVEAAITWPCEIIKHYSDENIGVYNNIGNGAKWVFSREKWAIFLEDDNLPEVTFFEFCKQMLEKYENDNRILWICGTNYLGKYNSPENFSYLFTKHMLPCGWASWSEKFINSYDGELKCLDSKFVRDNIKYQYYDKKSYNNSQSRFLSEYHNIKSGKRPISWDYQMDISIMLNHQLGIVPVYNQIKNIGVDEDTTHGGATWNNPMTRRLCGMSSYPMPFPLKHPPYILPDYKFEMLIKEIRQVPLWYRVGIKGAKIIRQLFNIPDTVSFSQKLFTIFDKRGK